MRVVIADDQVDVRSALRLLLEQEPGLRVVAEAGSAALCLAQAHRTQPDLILLDWELPGLPARELLSALRDMCEGVIIIALSGHPEARSAALAAGARAFISKGDPPDRVLAVLCAVNAGGCPDNPSRD